MQQALLLHKAGHLAAAEARYREALADAPGLADALHMLGVICLQAGDSLAAMHLLRRAGDAFSWRLPAVRQNLGLALASVVAGRNHEAVAALWAGYDRYREELQRAARPVAPRVGVVIPSYDHAGYIDAALESVYAQTYRDIEIVVIDDGSTDGSVAVIERALARSPFPARFMARANRGAAPTINEAVAMCDAPFINVLNSDDRFAPTRVQAMVDAVAGTGSAWGFSRVEMTDAAGAVRARAASPRVTLLHDLIAAVAASDTVGASFLSANGAITSGALFVSRLLFDRLGGFRDLRYTHDWDFCLRASVEAEPVFVASPQYLYRMHERNTILEAAAGVQVETGAMQLDFHRAAMATRAPANPFAPVPAVWGARYFAQLMANANVVHFTPEMLACVCDGIAQLCADAPE